MKEWSLDQTKEGRGHGFVACCVILTGLGYHKSNTHKQIGKQETLKAAQTRSALELKN